MIIRILSKKTQLYLLRYIIIGQVEIIDAILALIGKLL